MTVRAAALRVGVLCLCGGLAAMAAEPTTAARQAVVDHYATLARAADPGFKVFDAAAGQAFFLARPGTGGADTPSCSTCHTTNPQARGETRAGKAIEPMAVSRSPDRFTDLDKVEKWFRRNCSTVYGRDCTPVERGDFIAFMASQ